MRGRPPKPTALKLLTGNPGKRRLPAEPAYPREAPACPPHLDREASNEWARLVGTLHGAGVLRQTDRGILAAYCQAWSRWVGAERELKKSTPVLAGEKGLYQNPWVHVANKAIEQMSALGAQLGLSPSSRARVSGALPVETAAKHGPRAIADPVLDG